MFTECCESGTWALTDSGRKLSGFRTKLIAYHRSVFNSLLLTTETVITLWNRLDNAAALAAYNTKTKQRNRNHINYSNSRVTADCSECIKQCRHIATVDK